MATMLPLYGRAALWAVLAVALVLVLALIVRNRMHAGFFYPDFTGDYPRLSPADLGLEHEEFFLASEDGTRLRAWWLPHEGSREAVVFLHGNALDLELAERVRTISLLHEWGYHVLAIDYRGYGGSDGRPSHEGVHADARAAVLWTAGRPEVDRMALYGHSLGGSLALCVAGASDKVATVAVQGAFASSAAMVRGVLRGMVGGALAGLLTDALFDSPIEPLEALDGWNVPVLLMAGAEDDIVPAGMTRRLYDDLGPERAELWVERGAGHVEALEVSPRRYKARLEAFLARTLRGEAHPRISARWAEGRLHVHCTGASPGDLAVEVYLWGEGGAETWLETRAPCPDGSVLLEPGFTPLGAAALPALPDAGTSAPAAAREGEED
jgi:pimeloyl-ACP methyl ester carboxylesterase